MEQSDEALVALYSAGSESAYNELVKRHLGGVYSFTLRLVGSDEAAKDISQEVFVKAWRGLKKFDQSQASFKTWLMRIARNAAVDYLRKKKHIPLSAFETEDGNAITDTLADDTPSIEESLASLADQEAVMQAVKQLPEAQREVVLLHYQSDMTFEEIGKVLNTSPNTVKSRHRRGLHRLRELVRILPV